MYWRERTIPDDNRRRRSLRNAHETALTVRRPQAAVLAQAVTIRIRKVIVSEPDSYRRTLAAGMAATAIPRKANGVERLPLVVRELQWLTSIQNELRDIVVLENRVSDSLGDEMHCNEDGRLQWSCWLIF